MMKQLPENIQFEHIPFHLDLNADDVVFVSSNIATIAQNAKKENTSLNLQLLIDNFQQVLSFGTLIIPAYTDSLKNGDTFDAKKTKPTIGALPNRVFRRKDFVRTKDPLHSVFVWGKAADKVSELQDNSTFGENSIFHYLEQSNAVFLFIDIHPQECFTYTHYVEEKLRVPYRAYKEIALNVVEDGKKHPQTVKFYTKKKGVLSNIYALIDTYHQRQLMKRYQYKSFYIDKISAQEATQVMVEKLEQKEYFYKFSLIRYLKDVVNAILRPTST